jgi:hypothetical protein
VFFLKGKMIIEQDKAMDFWAYYFWRGWVKVEDPMADLGWSFVIGIVYPLVN